MTLRVAIILILCLFGIGPLLLLTGVSVPVMAERLEQAAQQESLARLGEDQSLLRIRVEGIKERAASLASLPGARDILGRGGAAGISDALARKRFTGLANRWFRHRIAITDIWLLNTSCQELFHLGRHGDGPLGAVDAGRPPEEDRDAFCAEGASLSAGEVRVSSLQAAPEESPAVPRAYFISLATPVVIEGGEVAGVLRLRIDMADFLRGYAATFLLPGTVAGAESTAYSLAGGVPLGRKPVIAPGGDGGRVAWQPVLFNADGPPALWIGNPVDLGGAELLLKRQRGKVIAIVLALVVAVILFAGGIGAWVDRRKTELLAGVGGILGSGRQVMLGGQLFSDLRQLAGELNGLAEQYHRMRLAWQRAEDELRAQNNQLEVAVDQRTAELFATNEQLREEVEERSRAEEELRLHRDHLEELVRQRVVELAETNEHLELEIVRRRHAQQTLRESEERLRTILDAVDIGIFIVDRENRTLIYVNPAAAAMIGAVSGEALCGQACHHYFCLRRTRAVCPCIDNQESIKLAARTLTKVDGTPFEVLKTVVPMVVGGRSVFLESITDITELRRMAEKNQTLQAQLLQSQKMEAIGVLAGGVAHDFNNLLTVIQGSAELALAATEMEHDAPGRRYLTQIKETTDRAGNLVRQLLLFSRTQPAALVTLRLNTVIENLLRMLSRLIGEDIAIETGLAADLWPILGDAGNVEQLLMNLAVNGRDAMAGGGVLRITTDNAELDTAAVEAWPEARPGRFVVLAVIDSGTGIDADRLDHIFEPFYTTKEAGKGTGLGLAVVYGIVKQHGGWIVVDSLPGRGTTFKVYLPAVTENALPQGREEDAPAAVSGGKGERILVVEDEEAVRSLIRDTLAQNDFEVFTAASVAEALEVFQRKNGQFDLLLSDVVLPGDRNGIELADAVLIDQPRLPVLLCSGYTDHKSQWPVIVERGFFFLQKPFNIVALLQAVREAINSNNSKNRP